MVMRLRVLWLRIDAWRFQRFPPRRMWVEGLRLKYIGRLKKRPVYFHRDLGNFDGLQFLMSNPFATHRDFYMTGTQGMMQLVATNRKER